MSGGQGLQRLDNTSPSSRRKPERPSLSCTECRRRKQKCNQGNPCTNCSRRFPQPICEYDTKVSRRSAKPVHPMPRGDRCLRVCPEADMTSAWVNSAAKLFCRSKRAGDKPSEDPTLGVVDNDGPYSHLKYAGVHDAILQIELPTRVIKRESTDAESGGYPSNSEAPTDADSPGPWRPLNNPGRDPKAANASKIINQAIRKIVKERCRSFDVVQNDDWHISSEMVMRAAHEAMPPPKPVDNFFDDLRHLPMAPTRLNNELVRTHLQLLCRFKVSIDGNPGPDNAFMRHWIPYTIQEPAMLQVVLYTSACFLKETGHVPKTLAMAYKGAAYQALNKSLRNEKTQCSDGVVLAVGQLVMDEWYWGSTADLHAHRHGLRMMIRMRGGLQYLGMHGFLAKMLLLNDAGLALAHEIEPGLFDRPGYEFEDPIMVPFQTSLNSPFVSGWPTFASSSSSALLHPSTAAILDDMRLLIETVLSGMDESSEHTNPHKLASTVSWIEQRLKTLPQEIFQLPDRHSRESSRTSPTANSSDSTYSSPAEQVVNAPDPTYSWVRRTATIYCRAISNRQPLSMACTPADFEYLWQFTFRIQTDGSWTTVGILFWVITAIMPASLSHPGTRFMKTVMVCCLMNMGVDNWHVATDAVRRALKLQRWLEGGIARDNRIFGGGKGIDKHGFALKDKLGNFGLTPHYEDGEFDAG